MGWNDVLENDYLKNLGVRHHSHFFDWKSHNQSVNFKGFHFFEVQRSVFMEAEEVLSQVLICSQFEFILLSRINLALTIYTCLHWLSFNGLVLHKVCEEFTFLNSFREELRDFTCMLGFDDTLFLDLERFHYLFWSYKSCKSKY